MSSRLMAVVAVMLKHATSDQRVVKAPFPGENVWKNAAVTYLVVAELICSLCFHCCLGLPVTSEQY